MVPTVLLFVVLPTVGAGLAFAGRDRAPSLSRSGSARIGPAAPLAFDAEPASYRIAYDVELHRDTKVVRNHQVVEVQRPFDARVEDLAAGAAPEVRTSRFGALTVGTGLGPRSVVSPPAPASGDLRFATALPEAVRRGLAQVRERRRVAGRECQVVRVGGEVSSGTLFPFVAAPAAERADVCVDRAGLLLEEVWTRGDQPLRRRVARSVEVGVALAEERFQQPGEQPLESGGGVLLPDTGDAAGGPRLGLPDVPAGFVPVGRFLTRPPELGTTAERTGTPTSALTVVEVWRRGPDLLALAQTTGATPSALPSDATVRTVDLGPLGQGRAHLDLRGNEVRLAGPSGSVVSLTGSLPEGELVALARTLRAG